ncbi:MAG: DUF3089 domain-containing protein [Micropepsaceae bacterium]
MWRLLRILFAIVLFVVAVLAGIYLTGNTVNVIALLAGPPKVWDLSKKAPEPNYADAASWAAFPGKESLALMTPKGIAAALDPKAVDVFFIHPTGYLNGGDWNSPLNADSRTEENTKWMMANQASAFNGCCNVFAPRYREASIFRYLNAPEDIGQKAMDFAYADVVRAFEYYMAHENKGKPFIIASHSQGSTHAFRLLKEKIDGTNLQASMIAAYVIGTRVTNVEAASLKSIKVCNSAAETGCLVHWATFGDGGTPPSEMTGLVCVNPLSWSRDGGKAEAELHQGGVPASGRFSARIWGDDAPQGVQFEPLEAPLPKATWAECRDGILYVSDQSSTIFKGLIIPGKNYHGLDYPLFHMDIRSNADARVKAYLSKALTDGFVPKPQE